MKIRRIAIALLELSSVFYLTNCMGKGSGNNPSEPSAIFVTPQPISIAAGSTVIFTASTTNAAGFTPGWEINDENTVSGGVGTLSSYSGTTVTYTAPSSPPIYPFPVTPGTPGPTQGSVTLEANVENTAGCDEVTSSATFVITAPSVTVGLSPATATVSGGGNTTSFTGYAVGSVNAALTWQVNGVTGGSATYGTINSTGNSVVYTAPAAIPMTGNTVTITMLSQADPSKTATATVTLH